MRLGGRRRRGERKRRMRSDISERDDDGNALIEFVIRLS